MNFRKVLKEAKRSADKSHGVLVVNFRNIYLNRGSFQDVVDVCEWLVAEIIKDSWATTACDFADWRALGSASSLEARMEEDSTLIESVGRLAIQGVTAEGYDISSDENARVERTI